MDTLIENITLVYGVGAGIAIVVIWELIQHFVWPYLKQLFTKKDKTVEEKNINTNNTNVVVNNNNKPDGVYSKEDMIYDAVKELQSSVKSISNELSIVNTDLNNFKNETSKQFAYIDSRLEETQVNAIVKGYNQIEELKYKNEQKMFIDSLLLGQEASDVLKKYTEKINCTHIFVASFHNGTSSLTGSPYFKFDIIKEEFNPHDIQENDHAFEQVYRNNQLSLYGKLPLQLINDKMLYFNLDDEKSKSIMQKLDKVIISRMQGFGIKQIALHVTYDNTLISGFIGCVKYDNEPMNLEQFKLCAKELEIIYSKNKHTLEHIDNI